MPQENNTKQESPKQVIGRSKKLPSWHVYPGDWWRDAGVQSLDHEHKGVWFELLLLMFDSQERGVLLLNGKPYPLEALSKRLAIDKQTLSKILNLLIESGVAKTRSDGAIFNARMVRDEDLSKVRAQVGSIGGGKAKGKQKVSKVLSKTKANTEVEIEDEDEDEDLKRRGGLLLPQGFQTPEIKRWVTAWRKKLRERFRREYDQIQLEAHCAQFGTAAKFLEALKFSCGLSEAKNLYSPPAPDPKNSKSGSVPASESRHPAIMATRNEAAAVIANVNIPIRSIK